MKSTVFVLFALTALFGQVVCQNFANATTDCGRRAAKCWTDQQAGMNASDASLDFETGCKLYKKYLDCIDVVLKDSRCVNNSEVNQVVSFATEDRNTICENNGSRTKCGSDVQRCLQTALNIEVYFLINKTKAACSAYNTYVDCTSTVKSDSGCSDTVKELLASFQTKLFQEELYNGCNGPCEKQVSVCLANLTAKIVDGDYVNMNWKTFCRVAFDSAWCVSNLTSVANCSQDTLVQELSDRNNSAFTQYCDGEKPAYCIDEIETCSNIWHSETKNVPIDKQCQAAKDYLECAQKIKCSKDLTNLLVALRVGIESDETKTHCPSVGSCVDRIGVCNSWQSDISMTSNVTQKDTDCSLVKNAIACFNYVREDAACIRDSIPKSDFESSLTKLRDSTCVGGFGKMSISLFLLAFVLILNAIRFL